MQVVMQAKTRKQPDLTLSLRAPDRLRARAGFVTGLAVLAVAGYLCFDCFDTGHAGACT